jgi:cytochrome d ubiquinol oxidase subunit I
MWPLGFIAILAGWFVTEQGRQPWVVQGLLRTADATSPVPGASVASTLALFVFIYGIVFSMGIYYINRLIHAGPKGEATAAPQGLPNRPLSAAEEAAREATGRRPGSGARPLTPPKG